MIKKVKEQYYNNILSKVRSYKKKKVGLERIKTDHEPIAQAFNNPLI